MSVKLKITGTQAFEQKTRSFMSALRKRLRVSFEAQAMRLLQRTKANMISSGLHNRTHEMERSAVAEGGVKGRTAFVRIVFEQPGAPYAAWQEHGLPPRPAHQRAISRRGVVNPMLGRAYHGKKPWGLIGRHFLEQSGRETLPETQASAESALEATVADWNMKRGLDVNA